MNKRIDNAIENITYANVKDSGKRTDVIKKKLKSFIFKLVGQDMYLYTTIRNLSMIDIFTEEGLWQV